MPTFNPLVDPLLTDLYQLTMAYGYWKNGSHGKPAVFDLFFRKCPFGGEFAVFAGLGQVLDFVEGFRVTPAHTDWLRGLPEFRDKEPAFFDWIQGLDCSGVRIHAQAEGSLAFPRVPLLRVEGPLAVAQLLETTLLALVNYPSLVATNAARYRLAAGWDKSLLEFGLRRAQGPDGGLSASYYSYLGGFDATSNVKAGELFGLPVAGTHAHAFVESFTGLDEVAGRRLAPAGAPGGRDGPEAADFTARVLVWRRKLGFTGSNDSELAAFTAYAAAFPERFVALVDTYSTLESGVPNFLCVAAALLELGWQPRGIRLDSGDLAYLSLEAKRLFRAAAAASGLPLDQCTVTASNDINETILHALRQQPHGIDKFGIGTNLVTCESQPAFGGVYKLVEIDGHPRVKLSENIVKVTIPGSKLAWRLLGQDGRALADLLCLADEPAPKVGEPVLCRSPFDRHKKVNVIPARVQPLLPCVWDGRRLQPSRTPAEIRAGLIDDLQTHLRPDQLRPENPTGYKVSLSDRLFTMMHELIEKESVTKTLS
jgi:nicotinate phosphoribosyltransferase